MTDPKPAAHAVSAQPVHLKGMRDYRIIVWQVIGAVAGVWAASVLALAIVAHLRGWI